MPTKSTTEVEWFYDDYLRRLGPTYGGYHIITPETPITGGAFGTSTSSDAYEDFSVGGQTYRGKNSPLVTVDPAQAPDIYEELWQGARQRAQSSGLVRRARIPKAAYDTVDAVMSSYWAPTRTEEITDAIMTSRDPGQFIDVSVFVEEKAGLCLQATLAEGYLIERFITEGFAPGFARLDGNMIRRHNRPWEGHVWLRYTDRPHLESPFQSLGAVILDNNWRVCNTLWSALQRRFWYARPTDEVEALTELSSRSKVAARLIDRLGSLATK